MKTETKEIEKTIKETVTKYIANDGTEFTSKSECETYEQSAAFALKQRLLEIIKPLKIPYLEGLDSMLDDYRNEAEYFSVKFSSETDIKNFIAWLEAKGNYVGGNTEWSKDHPESNDIYEKFKDLKVGVQYVYLEREDWSVITSKEKIQQCLDTGWANMFKEAE